MALGEVYTVALFVLMLITPGFQYDGDLDARTALFHDLFNDYDKDVLPTGSFNDNNNTIILPVNVSFGLGINEIGDVDINGGTISATVFWQMSWEDRRLEWEYEQYNDILAIIVPISKIWKPDIAIFNGESHILIDEPTAKLSSTGRVDYSPPYQMKTSYIPDLRYFPYDEQVCRYKFGSWAYSGNYINLTLMDETYPVLFNDFWTPNKWTVVNTWARRNAIRYACCNSLYYDAVFFIKIKRRQASFYGSCVVIPSILVTLMTLLVFGLPPASQEKMTLNMTILLCQIIFMWMIFTTVSQPTILSSYLLFSIFMVTLAISETTIVYNVYHRHGPMLPIVRKIFLDVLARPLCLASHKMLSYEGRSRSSQKRERCQEDGFKGDEMQMNGNDNVLKIAREQVEQNPIFFLSLFSYVLICERKP
ncbi:neuronal acetylcholine receptor subunit alpha-2-like [Saccoglossus kowalevskii]|uniref:Neuronal acetylcholine receptor subunit alpha-2-like n=1 Tax=Saccoglossus kowalevskii TaxID=10224 RepID=A0ABM0M2P9_SACKO|nr:PREDICTED: neuronal acetylcholine receptor subunit alpha-2-like [Saccoglossus kowalevskii]